MVDLRRLGSPERPTFGLDTFGDLGSAPDGSPVPHAEAIRQVVDEAVLADEVGLDFFGVGRAPPRRLRRSARPTWCWPRSPAQTGGSGSARR